jgi:hypothetical protein
VSTTQLAARLDGVIDQHVDSLTKLVEAALDPHLDPLVACRYADAACRVLRASSAMLQDLYQQLANDGKPAQDRPN